MKPGHIKVFDGLRMTTEHIEHMQGAIHSALQEIRKILGLGRVYFGFQVSAEDDRILTVLPGLGFDHQGNRLVSEEPKTVPISFDLEEEVKFVCLKYDQVEVGQVEEGHFTLIWDSCSVLLRSTLPEPRENLVAVARVNKSMEGGINKLTINSLLTIGNDKIAIGEASEVSSNNQVIAAANSETITAAEVAVSENINTGERDTAAVSGEETESIGELSISKAEASVGLVPEFNPWRLQLRQGVVRLITEKGSETRLNRLILEPLRRKLSDGDGQREIELMVKLAEEEIALDFTPVSISFQTIVNTSLSILSSLSEGRSAATEVKYHATAQGEASFAEDAISQFGVSKIQSQVMTGSALLKWSGSDLTENGIAHLPFADKSAQTQSGGANVFPFHNLLLVIKADISNSFGFKVVCSLGWKGEITGELIHSLETNDANIVWEILTGWKAMGKSLTSST